MLENFDKIEKDGLKVENPIPVGNALVCISFQHTLFLFSIPSLPLPLSSTSLPPLTPLSYLCLCFYTPFALAGSFTLYSRQHSKYSFSIAASLFSEKVRLRIHHFHGIIREVNKFNEETIYCSFLFIIFLSKKNDLRLDRYSLWDISMRIYMYIFFFSSNEF